MKEDLVLKKAFLGGFKKQGVLDLIEKIQSNHIDDSESLKSKNSEIEALKDEVAKFEDKLEEEKKRFSALASLNDDYCERIYELEEQIRAQSIEFEGIKEDFMRLKKVEDQIGALLVDAVLYSDRVTERAKTEADSITDSAKNTLSNTALDVSKLSKDISEISADFKLGVTNLVSKVEALSETLNNLTDSFEDRKEDIHDSYDASEAIERFLQNPPFSEDELAADRKTEKEFLETESVSEEESEVFIENGEGRAAFQTEAVIGEESLPDEEIESDVNTYHSETAYIADETVIEQNADFDEPEEEEFINNEVLEEGFAAEDSEENLNISSFEEPISAENEEVAEDFPFEEEVLEGAAPDLSEDTATLENGESEKTEEEFWTDFDEEESESVEDEFAENAESLEADIDLADDPDQADELDQFDDGDTPEPISQEEEALVLEEELESDDDFVGEPDNEDDLAAIHEANFNFGAENNEVVEEVADSTAEEEELPSAQEFEIIGDEAEVNESKEEIAKEKAVPSRNGVSASEVEELLKIFADF